MCVFVFYIRTHVYICARVLDLQDDAKLKAERMAEVRFSAERFAYARLLHAVRLIQ